MITLEKWQSMTWQERGTLLAKISQQDSDGETSPQLATKMWSMADRFGQAPKSFRHLCLLMGQTPPHKLRGREVFPFVAKMFELFGGASPDELCLAVVNAFENDAPKIEEQLCDCEQCTC